MNIQNILKEINDVFLSLGFVEQPVGKNHFSYLRRKNCYCKITFLKDFVAFVIESANNAQDAENGILEDGDLYFIDTPTEKLLQQLKEDIRNYYME